MEDRARRWLRWALIAATIGFRLPELRNAAAVNSDVSIVGLQAMAMSRGEWTAQLQGSPYQTSVDAAVAAIYFALFGATPLVLMISVLVEHLLVVAVVYGILGRVVGAVRAALLTSLVVFTTCVVNVYALHPPRQAALTLAFVSLWIFSADHRIASPRARAALGALCCAFSIFADPYAVVFAPPLAIHAWRTIVATQTSSRQRMELGAIFVGAFVIGLIPLAFLWSHHGGPPTQIVPTLAGVGSRARLLVSSCLPVALGYRIPASTDGIPIGTIPEHAVSLVIVLIAVALAIVRAGGSNRAARDLGIFGVATCIANAVGFVLASSAVDLQSQRYLVAMSLALPFVFLPLASLLDGKRLAVAVFPVVATFAVAGWRAYGSRVDGLSIRPYAAGLEADQSHVARYMEEHGVKYGFANYWEAYTMTFDAHEDVIIVPREPWLDRTPVARSRAIASDRRAYIVNRAFGWDATALTDFWLRPLGVAAERADFGRYTVLILNRTTASPPAARVTTTSKR